MPTNVIIGAASDQDRVLCFEPDNASVTTIEVSGRELRIVELGRERDGGKEGSPSIETI